MSPSTAPVLHVQAMRVYWEDTDAGGVVFYANYLKFFERARTEWLRRLGYSQEALRLTDDPARRVMFMVTDTQLQYRRPARLDDWIEVDVALQRPGAASLEIRQQAWRGPELLCEGTIRIGCVDPLTLRPKRLPDDLQRALRNPAGPDALNTT